MKLESLLASLPADQWQTAPAIAFDWHDGPRQGVCCLARPGGEFLFELLDERPTNDDLDDRLFRLSEIPPGSVENLLCALRDLGKPASPVWAPVWSFPAELTRNQAEQHVQRIEAGARPTNLVISTRDMIHFRGCWTVDRTDRAVDDWFSALGIA